MTLKPLPANSVTKALPRPAVHPVTTKNNQKKNNTQSGEFTQAVIVHTSTCLEKKKQKENEEAVAQSALIRKQHQEVDLKQRSHRLLFRHHYSLSV